MLRTAQDISLECGARLHTPGREREFAKLTDTQNQPPDL